MYTLKFDSHMVCCLHWLPGMVMAGCFLGAFLYGLVDPWVTANMSYKTPKTAREIW